MGSAPLLISGLILMLFQFAKTFLVDYYFEELQQLKFSVFDVDDRKHLDDTSRHDLIGDMECSLADIVSAGQEYRRNLRLKGERGCGHSEPPISMMT